MAPGGLQTGADKGNTRKRRSVDSSDSETSESQGLIQSLRDEIESIKRPSGTQKNPARTCRDLYMCNGNINDGLYWIDPNHGCSGDAIQVFCNFTGGGQTCIHPDVNTKQGPNKRWKKLTGAEWFSEYEGGYEISYTGVGKTQLNFLRLLSEKATQMINITCTGSQGCFDRNSNIVEKAIKLQGANDGVLSFMKDDDSSIKITQVRKDWKAVIQVETEDLNQMPIVDFAPGEFLTSNEFGFEVGPICFS